jgi:hypothetical protein
LFYVLGFAIILVLAIVGLRTRQRSEDAMAGAHRIKIKLGDAEFEAEGSEDRVQSQYEQFLAALDRTSTKAPAKVSTAETKTETRSVDDTVVARVFELRSDGVVALRFRLPEETEPADQILLLLYGYRRLKQEESVLATQLLRAAAVSGLGIDRIDRAADAHIPRFILRGGQKKGTNYMLTNQGMGRAEEMVGGLPG